MNKLFPWISGDKSKQAERSGKTPERAEDALFEATAAAATGDIKAATKLFEESIRIYHSLGLKQEEAVANHKYAAALARASEFTLAFEVFTTSVSLYRALSLEAELALVLRDVGMAHADYSDPENASPCFEESLKLFKSLQITDGVAGTLQAMGRAAVLDGNADDAQSCYEQSIALYTELGDSDRAAICHVCLSSIAISQNEFDKAREQYSASIDCYRANHAFSPLLNILTDLGAEPFADRSAVLAGELLDAAITVYTRSATADAAGAEAPNSEQSASGTNDVKSDNMASATNQRAEASACLSLSPVAFGQGRAELASSLLVRAIDIAKELSDINLLCYSLHEAGGISSQNEDLPAARKYYTLLKEAADAADLDAYRATAVYSLAHADYLAGDIDSAIRNCEACLELYKSVGNVSATARTLTLYGVLIHEQGDSETGLTLLNESLALCRRNDDSWGSAAALQCIGSVAKDLDPVYARACLQECLDTDGVGDFRIATALQSLAELDLLEGEIGAAFECSSRALSIRKEIKHSIGAAHSLELCAHVAAEWGDIETAVILLSRSEMILTKLGIPLPPPMQARYESNLAKLKSELSPDEFEKAWIEGTTLTLDEIIDEVELMLEAVEPEEELDDETEDELIYDDEE